MTNPHTDDRHPFWKVAAIFGDEESAEDFAYTIGLHERGVPELWVASRPALGDDPGADWHFSLRDMGLLLNKLSWEWLAGEKVVGDTFEETYDAGLVTVRFQIDPPGDRDALEAFQIAPEATVVPVRWSLHRAPAGENLPMEPASQTAAAARWDELTAGLGDLPPAPEGWELASVPDWSPQGKYGPRTPLVTTLAAYVWGAAPDELLAVVNAALDIQSAKTLTRRWATFAAIARGAGREGALQLLTDDIGDLVDAFVPGMASEVLRDVGDPEDPEEVDFLVEIVRRILMTTLGAEAIADLLPEEERLECLGFVLAIRAGSSNVPGRDWLASDAVRAAVDDFISDIGVVGVTVIHDCHEAAEEDEYWRVIGLLRAENLTTASGWWPGDEPGNDGALQQFGSLVAAMLTHRMKFSAEELDAFVTPYDGRIPQLRELLNTPV
ncbi:hypothetical protein ABIE44_002762 [Marmoricola sp. OAE513]|uniref:hypothetical protein n=1 Tax=Marmoricola sp. OAE513 TaxID=2817894 RepID=UPI001AE34643